MNDSRHALKPNYLEATIRETRRILDLKSSEIVDERLWRRAESSDAPISRTDTELDAATVKSSATYWFATVNHRMSVAM